VSESLIGDYLVEHGVLKKNHSSEAGRVLLEMQPSLVEFHYESASKYMEMTWKKVADSKSSSSLNGKLFELMLACVLIKEGIVPFYMEAEVQFVPNAKFDILLYSEEYGPVVISAKTSLRERYKQADLESYALRAVYRRSRSFLVTLDSHEAEGVQRKIEKGHVANLERVIIANESEFDKLITELKSMKLIPAPILPVLVGGKEIK
jgi:hypothetical protein